MKRSVHPIFTILFLSITTITICFRIIFSGKFTGGFPQLVHQNNPPVFNDTILRFAAVDLAESSFRHNVEQLVDNNFQGSVFLSKRHRINIRSKGVPVKLWNDFRQCLQTWWRSYRFQPDVMADLVNNVKIFKTGLNGSVLGGNVKYKTCAVVGNSGILLKSDLGGVIDDHEFVIRLNNARTSGYERNVGSKTSLSFVNSNVLHTCARREKCFCHPYGEKVPIMMYMCQMMHFVDYVVCGELHKAPLMVTDPRFDILCARIVKYYSVSRFVRETGKSLEAWAGSHDGSSFHYSSGMQAIMLALGICEKVSIFGFGKSDSAKHHYHTNQKAELHLHDYEAEYELYRDLVESPEKVPFISDKFKFPPVVIHR